MTNDDLEIIYILTNEAMPGYLKIGRTRDLAARIAALSKTTSLPLPFVCAYAAKVTDAAFVEQQIHLVFAPHRVSDRREFFTAPLGSAIAAIRMVAVAPVSTDSEEQNTFSHAAREAHEAVSDAPDVARISKEEALRDLQALLSQGGVIASQENLSVRWGRPKSTVSDWLFSWEAIGAVPTRQMAGRCKLISAA